MVGNGNEHGLVIGESTFGGVPALAEQPGAVVDYGSLIYLTLQRAKTAREAIATMADLMGEWAIVIQFCVINSLCCAVSCCVVLSIL